MSFSFANKFSIRKTDEGDAAAPQIDPVTGQPIVNSDSNAAPNKRRNASKQNPLLNAKTDDYADDNLLYIPKITKKERFKYFNRYMELNRHRKDSDYAIELEEIRHYPRKHVWIFGFVRSQLWDQWYLNFCLLWLVLLIAFVDGWAKAYAPMLIQLNAGNQLLMLPPVFMLICQVIPLLGTVYYMHFGYDLVHFLASVHFQTWVSFPRLSFPLSVSLLAVIF